MSKVEQGEHVKAPGLHLFGGEHPQALFIDELFVDGRTFTATTAGAAASSILDEAPAHAQAIHVAGHEIVSFDAQPSFSVNGVDHTVNVDTRMTLLDALWDKLDLTGSKKWCDQGRCGACTIHVNGERHLSCLTLTVAAQGLHVTTMISEEDTRSIYWA